MRRFAAHGESRNMRARLDVRGVRDHTKGT